MPVSKRSLLSELRQLLDSSQLLTTEADCVAYSYDNSRQQAMPVAVTFPSSGEQVAAIVSLCRKFGQAVVARGKGTCTTGAAVPLLNGVVLSFERMQDIIDINTHDRYAIVQPGVTNEMLQQALKAKGFFWPPDPTSSAVCTIGGNLACNAAGPRAVKYGTPRDNTLGLTFVDGHGRIVHTGVKTTKGVVGYDLTRLLIGSEGTLGIITEAVLRITPLPQAIATLQLSYRDIESASEAVTAIMQQPVLPCALEIMDGAALDMIRDFAAVNLPEQTRALLMIEVDGSNEQLASAVETVISAARNDGCLEAIAANSLAEKEQLWKLRKSLSPALRTIAPKKINEDVVVPVSRIPALINGLQQLSEKHQIRIVNFGHAGNGNLHVNLLTNPDDEEEAKRASACLKDVFELVLQLGGTLSGEHGIGLVKRDFVSLEISEPALALMQSIKQSFDPDGILNPMKTLPAQ